MMPEGATRIHSHGYVQQKVNGRWEYEHRLVAARSLGRPLKPGEVVQHRNRNREDNRPENLVVHESISAHNAKEHAARRLVCDQCGRIFVTAAGYSQTKNGRHYPRRFCSRSCFVESLRGKPFSGIPGHRKGGIAREDERDAA